MKRRPQALEIHGAVGGTRTRDLLITKLREYTIFSISYASSGSLKSEVFLPGSRSIYEPLFRLVDRSQRCHLEYQINNRVYVPTTANFIVETGCSRMGVIAELPKWPRRGGP